MAVQDGPPLGSTWDELDAEGRQFLLHDKKYIALTSFTQAAESPGGCGWAVLAHRADCRLRLLDSAGALEDAAQAVDMYNQEQRIRRPQSPVVPPADPLMTAADSLWQEAELEDALVLASRLQARRRQGLCRGEPDCQGGTLLGDERGQRVEGLKAKVSDALGPTVNRVLRKDLLRQMLRHKGINVNKLTAGPRFSWVTIPTFQAEPPTRPDPATATPLPLHLIWGDSQWNRAASDSEEDDEEEDDGEEEVGAAGKEEAADQGAPAAEAGGEQQATDGGQVEDGGEQGGGQGGEDSGEQGGGQDGGQGGEDSGEQGGGQGEEEGAGQGGEQGAEDKVVTIQDAGSKQVDANRSWGWYRQIPGHEHICADPLVAAQAERIAELRVLGLLERDRAYLRRLLLDLHSVQERPGQRVSAEGCPQCPGPNLRKLQDEELRAESEDDKQDPLAPSKWCCQDHVNLVLERIAHMVRAELKTTARYQHPPVGTGPSPEQRAQRSAARKERAFSTVHFMLRRVHDMLRVGQDRDAEHVGSRLTAYLEVLPCRVFEDRLLALARTLDCRAVAARRRNKSKFAIAMQKRRCTLASEHGLPELYGRALDEMALLLFSVADYSMAEASWNECLQQRLVHDDPQEKAQIVFQLARCCFVQGYLRMAGLRRKASKVTMMKVDHRSERGADSLAQSSSQVLRAHRVGSQSARSSRGSQGSGGSVGSGGSEDEELYEFEWTGAPNWSPDMLGYDLDSSDDETDSANVEQGPSELKPNSVEACLRIIMEDLNTQNPLVDYEFLLDMERYPDPEDVVRTYPFMPPDFNPDDNLMNRNYEVFEKRFRETCQYFVSDITGVAMSVKEEEPPQQEKPSPAPAAAPEPEPTPEPERTPEPEPEPTPGAGEEQDAAPVQEEPPAPTPEE